MEVQPALWGEVLWGSYPCSPCVSVGVISSIWVSFCFIKAWKAISDTPDSRVQLVAAELLRSHSARIQTDLVSCAKQEDWLTFFASISWSFGTAPVIPTFMVQEEFAEHLPSLMSWDHLVCLWSASQLHMACKVVQHSGGPTAVLCAMEKEGRHSTVL